MVKASSKNEGGERAGEGVHTFVEVIPKIEVSKRGREEIHRLVEISS